MGNCVAICAKNVALTHLGLYERPGTTDAHADVERLGAWVAVVELERGRMETKSTLHAPDEQLVAIQDQLPPEDTTSSRFFEAFGIGRVLRPPLSPEALTIPLPVHR